MFFVIISVPYYGITATEVFASGYPSVACNFEAAMDQDYIYVGF